MCNLVLVKLKTLGICCMYMVKWPTRPLAFYKMEWWFFIAWVDDSNSFAHYDRKPPVLNYDVFWDWKIAMACWPWNYLLICCSLFANGSQSEICIVMKAVYERKRCGWVSCANFFVPVCQCFGRAINCYWILSLAVPAASFALPKHWHTGTKKFQVFCILCTQSLWN